MLPPPEDGEVRVPPEHVHIEQLNSFYDVLYPIKNVDAEAEEVSLIRL